MFAAVGSRALTLTRPITLTLTRTVTLTRALAPGGTLGPRQAHTYPNPNPNPSPDPNPNQELNQPAPGPCYGVYCLDKPGSSELRKAKRDAHLAWLAEGGRVHLGGALQSPLGEDAGNVGTLLFVNGDELDEVRRWASEDPYNQAGLFESVLVAPVTQYALSAAGGKLAEL